MTIRLIRFVPCMMKTILCDWPITQMRCGIEGFWIQPNRRCALQIPPLPAPSWTGRIFCAATGQAYAIRAVDDSDPGWLMVTLDIEDATVLWDQELTTK